MDRLWPDRSSLHQMKVTSNGKAFVIWQIIMFSGEKIWLEYRMLLYSNVIKVFVFFFNAAQFGETVSIVSLFLKHMLFMS